MNSEQLFEKSLQLVPGGVHSPVRSFKGLHTTPRFFKKANGAYITDTEDKTYIDFCMSFGPLILGHRNPLVEEAIEKAIKDGWTYGACEPYSVELAEYIISRIDHIDQIRFVNSGTEAVMTAVRLARGITGRSKIIKFNGCYHGHLDSMLIKAGSGLAGTAEASSKGVTKYTADQTLICPLNDIEAVEKCFIEHKDEIAAIIIEPLPANSGILPQKIEYLKAIRALCDKYCAILIFDEVISGFRISFGGMAQETGINPDIVTYGKIIGGGMPVGAIAGPKKFMEFLAPAGPVYQAGTLSANPLAMRAGLATMQQLTPQAYTWLDNQSKKFIEVFKSWCRGNGYEKYHATQTHSLFWIHPNESEEVIRRAEDVPSDLMTMFYGLFEKLLPKGIYLSPNAYEISFISLAHDDKVLSDFEEKLNS